MLPKKLKDDAIVEALCELRFETGLLQEVVVGRLIDDPSSSVAWQRLPSANMPAEFIASSPDLRFRPWFENKDSDAKFIVRVGPNVISYHRLAPYPGWPAFKIEIDDAFQLLFKKVVELTTVRIGLRYVNALSALRHKISDVHDLWTQTAVGDQVISGPMLLQFEKQVASNHRVTSRLASPDFAKGLSTDAAAMVDIDVYSTNKLGTVSLSEVMSWIENAHSFEKAAFFDLIPPAVLQALVEE